MVLFRHVAKRMLRKKGLWVFTFVSMFGFALVLSFFNSTSTLNASIGILDRDGGLLAVRLIEEAERFGDVTLLRSTAEEDTFLEGQDIVLVIPERFTEAMFQTETPRLAFSATEGSDAALVEQALNAHLSRERQLLEASNYDLTVFRTLMDEEPSGGYTLTSEPFRESVQTTARTQAFLGLLSFVMMSASNREKANIWQISVTMAAAITGGAFIALTWLPDSLTVVGRLLPTYWFNAGVIDMYAGRFPAQSLSVLVVMTLIFFLATALYLKRRPLTT